MTDSFDPIAYLAFLRRHVWFAAAVIALAVGATAGISLLLAPRYTATATLVIEPPNANDPRAATAVSSVYLESLKGYEQFASSDSLFARACEQFGLLTGAEPPPMESFKKRVLRVSKVKDTRLLRISVTLPDPAMAHRVAQYLAEETVALNRSIAREGDRALLADMESQLTDVGKQLSDARAEYARVTASGTDRVLNEELHTLADLKARTSVEWLAAKASVAEYSVGGNETDLAAARARQETLAAEIARIDREAATKSAALSALRAKQDVAAEALRVADERFNAWSRHTTELASSATSRTEQLRVVDPGIVPQQPSYPHPLLFSLAALAIAAMLCLAWLTIRFVMEQQRRAATAAPSALAESAAEVRVMRGHR